ncbi:S-M checkpoint control protein rad4 [Candida viswanathii]|uniref:S-M checkpoint control protein rad4 n=1 Tax=Candida viswanathii TaxID=5486 RepID=A0A367XMH1_9ASCO|nr:S-M checkpoint control protein rad4 [Candida viswanathii]
MPTDKPFARLKFCCTGIDAKSKRDVVEKINALGGVHYYDLMTDVDYLIVGSRDTEKYKFSIKNRPDLKFIGPDVIDSIHKHWIDGEDDGLESLDIGSYFFPVFDDTPVCFARIQMTSAQVDHLIRKVDFRPTEDAAEYYKPSNLLKLFKQHGGAAKETLLRTHQVMITTDPRGTRYDKALEWGIQVVHPIWIVDSIIRGVALRPEDYLLTQNPNETYEKGCDVWDEVKTNGNISKQSSNYQIRRSESAEPEFKRKLANNKANADVWSSIMDNTKRQTKQIMRDRTWDEEEEDEENDEEDNAPESHGIDSEGDDDSNPILADKRNSSVSPESQLFLGFIFYTVGFDSRQFDLLSKAIESFLGEISNDPNDDSITHVVMPSEKGSQYMTVLKVLPKELKLRITNGFVKVVTEFFVERCMFYKRIVLDKWGQPIKGLLSSKKTFKICITGFTGVELMHIEKLINALNFDYCESLTEDRDLLILNINLFKQSFVKNSPKLFQYKCKEIVNCPTGGTVSLMSAKNKIDAAKQWNIPVVSIAYLWEIIEQSASRSHIVMPDITDLQWCIFAPSNYNKPKSLLEYVKNLDRASREGSMSSTCEDEAAESDHSGSTALVKLPSPRRPNARQKYGKLASAGKSPRSIRTKLQEAANSESMDIDTSANPDISLEESMMSQIRYQDNDSLFNQERLLEKLEGSAPNESNKRRRKE